MLYLCTGNILRWGGVAAFLAVLLLVSQAEAQGRGRGGERREGGQVTNQLRSVPIDAITSPLFIESDLGVIRDHVDLDEGQGLIIETLLADHVEAFNEGVQVLRVQIQEARMRILEGEEPEGARQQREAYESQMQDMREDMTERLRDAETSEDRLLIRGEFADAMRELTRVDRSTTEEGVEVLDWGAFLSQQSQLLRTWLETRRALEEEFSSSSTLVLEESQFDSWNAAMQAVRRRDMPGTGVLGGESIDLSIVLEGLELDSETRQALVPMLEQYAASIDGHIQARTSFLHEASPAISDTIGEGSWNRMRAIIQQEAEVRAGLRDENLSWFDSFSLVLPDDTSRLFQERVRLSQFGNIWRPGRLERMLESALQMEGLEEDQVAAIRSMEESCIANLMPLKSRVEAAYRFESPSQWAIDQQQKWVGSFNGAVVDPRIEGEAGREARDGLAKSEQACMKSLEDILGDRYSSLPGARNTPRRDGPSSGRSSESQRRRDELYKRFDRNGDGRLDADERDQMRREFQQERGRP